METGAWKAMKRSYLIVLGIGLGMVSCKFSFALAMALKYLVDTIALGHSLSKTLILLVFLAALALGVEHWPKVGDRVLKLFPALLLLGHLFTFLQYLWYCRRYDLDPLHWSAVVQREIWSMTRPDHIHTAKSCLSFLPKFFAYKTDVGHSFGALFPSWVSALQLFGVLVLIIACYLACLNILQNRSWGQAGSFVLCSFVLVKNVLDGGPWIPEVWAALPIFLFVLYGRKTVLASVPLVALYLASMPFWKTGALFIVLLNWLPALLMLLLPLLLQRKAVSALFVAVLVLLAPPVRDQLVPSASFQPYALSTINYGRESLKAGWTLDIISPRSLGPEPSAQISVVKEIADPASGLYLTEVRLLQDSTPYSLCSDLDLEPARWPISWYPGRVKVEADVLYLEGDHQSTLRSPLILDSKVQKAGKTMHLTLELKRGSNRGLAISLLGPKLSIVSRLNLSYPRHDEE